MLSKFALKAIVCEIWYQEYGLLESGIMQSSRYVQSLWENPPFPPSEKGNELHGRVNTDTGKNGNRGYE